MVMSRMAKKSRKCDHEEQLFLIECSCNTSYNKAI